MRQIQEMTREEYDYIIDYIQKSKRFRSKELENLHYLVQTYFDPKAKVCSTCPSQIKFLKGRLEKWYNKNKEEIDNLFNEQ